MLTPTVVAEVEVLRWPGEADRREACAERQVPCLLLVEDGVAPPVSGRLLEDWMRVPADELDLVARVRRLDALARRSSADPPVVDEQGILHVGLEWTALSVAEASLARRLTADFGHLVARAELLAALNPSAGSSGVSSLTGLNSAAAADRRPRTLDLQICRLRRRIAAVGLTISAVRGRGYVLESARLPRGSSGPRPS
jgi:DNA-binding response OmpR family regulator